MANQVEIKGVNVSVGDLVRVHSRLVEKGKARIFVFEGLVIAIHGTGSGKTFLVRRIATGNIGVERLWPVDSPWIEKIEIKKHGQVRRAKLYYLRDRQGKSALKVKSAAEPVKKVAAKSVPAKKTSPKAKAVKKSAGQKG